MLATLLGSETRARVLALLLAQPRRTYHLRELIRLSGGGASGVQREVERLEGQGLVDADAAALAGAPTAAVTSRVDARLRRRLPRVLAALRGARIERAVLFGSATQRGASAAPRDLDILVRLGGPLEGRAARFFELRRELERASGLPVDLVEEEAVTNPYLRDEIERTGVVILEAA